LMSKVLERNNLKKAIERVEANKGAPGVDGMSTDELRSYLRGNWETLKAQLEQGIYKPKPVRRVQIPKPNGGKRGLGIPTVLDRFIQQAILQVLTPIFDPMFSEQSYGFRPGRSAHHAVKQAKEYIQQGYWFVVDTDLEKFFDTVNHDILMGKLYQYIADNVMLKLIRKYLKSGVMINGCCVVREEGTPQGGPLSPLLSNIMLDEFDKELIKRGHKFVRYADDCNIYAKTKRAGRRIFASVTNFLEKKLKLKVNKEKSSVDYASRRKILGFKICGKMTVLAEQTVNRLKDKIRQLTGRNWSIDMPDRIKKLNDYLKGWLGYYSIANAKEKLGEIDEWMRRRLRMVMLKQWKRCKTKMRELKAL
jgi:RNA-directed DNA polymerase